MSGEHEGLLTPEEIKKIAEEVLEDAIAKLAPIPSLAAYVKAGAEAQLAKDKEHSASLTDEKTVEIIAQHICMNEGRNWDYLMGGKTQDNYRNNAKSLLSLSAPSVEARIALAVKMERERIRREVMADIDCWCKP